ncbi:membrane-bound PQQ-dependent dehydrogenase, glucose/quinate/shikimate family [Sphingomonas sp. KC8]|uniref:membrane-bound PQQ-dependent dehydrogenase, glucose/quinate/shikimate family n=1 Tax=Sphingomonas sp. KC8 TaxID=1030157 RepID=UPI0002E7DD0A|nr:membrane-bound PQQ-dependent dehydrogenase, glucose/quinate/shikimate family [Sphingomonas sp. KC8]ARS25820.1 quinoprotein glucose dehydrogenase [Sphingomonas sp. KC8]
MTLFSRRHVWVGLSVALYGLALTSAGGALLAAGGSPYFALAGGGTMVAGLLALRRRASALAVYGAVLLGSLIWAIAEAGTSFWLFAPRIGAPLVVGLFLSFPWIGRLRPMATRHARPLAIAAGITVAAAALLMAPWPKGGSTAAPAPTAETDWASFANGNDGRRHAAIGQITPGNVHTLEVAWTYRTGEDPTRLANPRNLPAFEATPLKVGPLLYLCTPRNQIIAVEAETGRERWRHDPHTDVRGASYLLTCRGVAYAETPHTKSCAQRIIAATGDGRLLALDAHSGRRCEAFGDRGEVSLRRNLGPIESGFYGVTSAPLVANGVVVVGAMVLDNQSTDVPGGVIRGYDVETGRQKWAFDTGADQPTSVGEPAPDKIYTRGSPNAWAPFSADEALGLVYVPTGNASPDYFGGQRSPAMNKHASSVLAINLATGRLRWSFQTVHQDVWDYDVSAQPTLVDMPGPNGFIPALIQSTKRGDLFVLDRRTGTPITTVEEMPVPRGGAAQDGLSPTQPFSTGMPFLGSARRTEASMWGITPFDQIWCRLRFRQTRYEGPFTPPSTHPTLQSPNQTGASSWGRMSIDTANNILVANTINLDSIVQLIPQADVAALRKTGVKAIHPQTGTPYAVTNTQFLSPLGLPCNAPPWGEMRAIDLKTRSVLWQKPFGTTANRLPLAIGIPLGLPSVAGPLTTASGLSFIGAADDGYFRAIETRTGRELWRSKLPAGGQAAPMTFMSRGGRQFVVIAAGGDRRLGTRLGDYVVAFALPKTGNPAR